jgi:hypothetical protein
MNTISEEVDNFKNGKVYFPQFHVLRTDWRNDKDLEAAVNFLLKEAAEAEKEGITIPEIDFD